MRSVTAEIDIVAGPESVLEAFVSLERIKDWWGAEDGVVENRVGGSWSLCWDHNRYVATGVIEIHEPGRRLRIGNYVYFNPEQGVFGPMTLTFTASKIAGGTRLHVEQGGYQGGSRWDWYHEVVTKAWPQVALNVKRVVESSDKARNVNGAAAI